MSNNDIESKVLYTYLCNTKNGKRINMTDVAQDVMREYGDQSSRLVSEITQRYGLRGQNGSKLSSLSLSYDQFSGYVNAYRSQYRPPSSYSIVDFVLQNRGGYNQNNNSYYDDDDDDDYEEPIYDAPQQNPFTKQPNPFNQPNPFTPPTNNRSSTPAAPSSSGGGISFGDVFSVIGGGLAGLGSLFSRLPWFIKVFLVIMAISLVVSLFNIGKSSGGGDFFGSLGQSISNTFGGWFGGGSSQEGVPSGANVIRYAQEAAAGESLIVVNVEFKGSFLNMIGHEPYELWVDQDLRNEIEIGKTTSVVFSKGSNFTVSVQNSEGISNIYNFTPSDANAVINLVCEVGEFPQLEVKGGSGALVSKSVFYGFKWS